MLLIGVIARENEAEAMQEFFELFKTPWELYQEHTTYDVVVATCDHPAEIQAKLLIIYGSEENSYDRQHELAPVRAQQASMLQYGDVPVPVYGNVSVFREKARTLITTAETSDRVAIVLQRGNCQVVRIGFDLFQEVEYILRHGQASRHARVPTLDIHILIMRDCMINAGLSFIEVLNRPAGFDFTACLTHDIDFLRISDHKFDHTMFGFLYRAVWRTFASFLKGHISLRKLVRNWTAACLLPGVYLGLIKDYFFQFDKYLEVEKGLVSTFFIIPFKNRAGKDKEGRIHKARAVRYDIGDIEPEIKKLMLAGREIALHGIDAWNDPDQGREELQRIARVTGNGQIGIRSHWLYQSEASPHYLEEAGFVYDSSAGYNEAVGYRSGTTQVFRPFGATRLLELPLHIMDTTLFYTGRMDLPERQAMVLVEEIITKTQRFGGILTINWHDRSLGPERLWDTFYESILTRLKSMRVWFTTVSQAVAWFRMRRSVVFNHISLCADKLQVSLSSSACDGPKLVLRVYLPRDHAPGSGDGHTEPGRIMDVAFSGDLEISLSL